MNNILSSAHVHTTFCDGKSTAREMAKEAYDRGFVSLGFSSHAAQTFNPAHPNDPDTEMGEPDDQFPDGMFRFEKRMK